MDFGNGWDLNDSQRRYLRLMDWIWEHAQHRPGRVDLQPLVDEQGQEPLFSDLRELRSAGWLGDREAGLAVVEILTSAGAARIEDLRRTADDPRNRRPASRDAMLHWLWRSKIDGNPSPELAAFSRSPYGSFYGTPFSEREIVDASESLLKEGYIRGTSSWGGGVTRPSLEPKGEQLAEQDSSVSAPQTPRSIEHVSYTISNSPGVNIAHQSPDSQQTSTVTINAEQQRQLQQLGEFLDYLAQEVPRLGLPAEIAVKAPAIASELRIQSELPSPNHTIIRQLLDDANELALLVASVPLGIGLSSLITEASRVLGIG